MVQNFYSIAFNSYLYAYMVYVVMEMSAETQLTEGRVISLITLAFVIKILHTVHLN